MTLPGERRDTLRLIDVAALGLGLLVAITVRAVLLPTSGLRGDLDLFASWAHALATAPLGQAYRTDLNFPPVMAYVYWIVGHAQAGFASATDAGDPAIRIALKLPAVLADAGLAAGVAWLLLDRPRLAIVAALGVGLSPAIVYVSAWWGQTDSLYALAGLVAAILAIGGRPNLAAVALAVALMTKPQALVFLPPFAAWAWARFGASHAIRAGLVAVATGLVLWFPFLVDGGPAAFLATVARLQSQDYAVLSVRAWNPWWILQTWAGGGQFLADGGALPGPLSPRILGVVMVGLLELVIVRAIARRPTPASLLLGLGASVLVSFTFLTAMHERYDYAAIVFLVPLLADRRVLAAWLVLSIAVALNLLAAIPPTREIAGALSVDGLAGLIGSTAITIVTIASVMLLWSRPADGRTEAEDVGEAGRGTRRRTSGDSGAATSGA
jgi:Gpi18-like mannosyltransferase